MNYSHLAEDIVERIKSPDKETVKLAKNELKELHSSLRENPAASREVHSIIIREAEKLETLEDPKARANLLRSLYLTCLRYGAEYFERLSDIIIKGAQDKNGHIRVAAVRIADYLIMGSGHYILAETDDSEDPETSMLLKYQDAIDKIFVAIKKHEFPGLKRYKYVSSLPTGIYKSLQMLQNNFISSCDYYESQRVLKYVAKNLDKWDLYYDAMENLNAGWARTAESLLKKALETDNSFVAAHVGLVAVYEKTGDERQRRVHILAGYDKTITRFSGLPEDISYGEIEDRQYFRAIYSRAALFHEDGEKNRADKLYRHLLKLNPNDNIGARYLAAALYAGFLPEDVDDMFDEGNRIQDWSKSENLLWEQNNIHKFWDPPEY